MNPGIRLLRHELRTRRVILVRIFAWSVLEAAPALVSGLAIARATDRFLAHDAAGGFAWLAVLLAAAVLGALATRRMFPWLARVVERLKTAHQRLAHAEVARTAPEHDLLEVVEIEEQSGLSRWGWAAYYAELQGGNRDLMLIAKPSAASAIRSRHA